MQKIDGIYQVVRVVKRTLEKPQVKRGIKWTTALGIIVGLILFISSIFIFHPFRLIDAKTAFRSDEKPTFAFELPHRKINSVGKSLSMGFSAHAQEEPQISTNPDNPNQIIAEVEGSKISVEIKNNYDQPVAIDKTIESVEGDKAQIVLSQEKEQQIKPGKYQLEVNVEYEGKTYNYSQDFTWGVLAVNTDKSKYLPGEEAYLQMAALKDDGHTICDGNLKLQITNPKTQTETLLTENNTIEKSGKCLDGNVSYVPDYFAHYKTDQPGLYEIKLTNLANGYEIIDHFEVVESVLFEIERESATRIYPPADYYMKLKIIANEDFQGEVIEKVPDSFEITNAENVTSDGQKKTLTWKVDWEKGETYELTYNYNAPDISPYLYLLGPLEIRGYKNKDIGNCDIENSMKIENCKFKIVFKEARQWQIAADAVKTSNGTGGGTWATGSTWVGGVAPVAGVDSVIIATGDTVNIGTSTTIVGVQINASGILTHTSNRTLGMSGNYTNNGTHTNGTGAFTLSGSGTIIDGTGTDGGSGAFTLTNAKTINGTAPAANLTVSTTVAVSAATTITNNGSFTANATTGITGGNATTSIWTQGANSTLACKGSTTACLNTGVLNASASGNTVNYTGVAQTVKATATYYNLTLSGSLAKTLTVTTTAISGNLTLSGTATTATVVALTVGGNVIVGTGTTLTLAGFTFGVTGTTDVTGSLINSSATAAKTFTGDVTLNSGAIWNESAAPAINFGGSLTNNATTWTGNTGIHTFTGSGKTISGSQTTTIANITIGAGASVTNSGTVTCSTALASGGAGSTWINGDGASGTLNFAGSSIGVTTFTASAAGNLVNYNGVAQTVFATATYHDLTLSTSNAKTWGANPTAVDGDLTLSGTATTAPSAATVTVGGSVAIGTGTTLTAPTTLNIAGDYTNSSTLTPGAGTIVFNAASPNIQLVNAGGTGAGKPFNHLTHSGTGTLQLVTTTIDVGGNFSQTAGTFDAGTNNLSQNFAGNFSLSNGTFYSKGGTLTFDGVTTYTDSNTGGNPLQDIGTVVVNGTSVTLASSMTIDTVNVSAGTLDLVDSGYILTLTGTDATATVLTVGGTLDPGTNSTVKYLATNSGGNVNITTATYNNLDLSPTVTETYVLTGDLTIATGKNLTGGLNIGSNCTLDAVLGSDYDIDVAGNWANAGIFTSRNNTITLTGAGASTQEISGDNTFYNLTAQAANARTLKFESSKTQAVTNILDIDGSLNQRIILTTITGTTQWKINPTNTTTVTYVDVNNSNNLGASLCAAFSISTNDNNTLWGVSEGATCGANPYDPADLAQKKTDNTPIAADGWTNETSVKFTATVSDFDLDQVQLCVEKQLMGTPFTDSEDGCGALVDSGEMADYTIGSHTPDASYHWQARAKDATAKYSNWVAFTCGASRCYGIDTSKPTGGSVYDGTEVGVDHDFNDGTLNSLSANWTGFSAGVSGLDKYQYAIGTTQGGTDIRDWTDNSTTESVTATITGGTLAEMYTSRKYYFAVRAVDKAGNTQETPSYSNGQKILPQLSFVLGDNSIIFDNLNNINNYNNSKNFTINPVTNAYNGFTVKAYESQPLTSIPYPLKTIPDFQGGTYGSPGSWPAGLCTYGVNCGFGYSTSDPDIVGIDKWLTHTKFAPFSSSPPGDTIADHETTVKINGSTGEADETFTIYNNVAVDPSQAASQYQTTVIFIVTANF